MIKALFRKQFSELISQFSRGKRGKKSGKNTGLIIFLAVYALVYVSVGFSFYAVSKAILEALTPTTMPLFYLMLGLISAAIGLLGSVFNAYSTIFEAKDNEMLLSLPIPPRRIVFVRVTSLAAMTVMYEGIILLPAFIAFVKNASPTLAGAVNAFFLFIPLCLFVVSISLGLAFVVAAVARHVKNKKAVTLIASLVLVLFFYFLYFRAQSLVSRLTEMAEIPAGIRYGLFFFYALGLASTGKVSGVLIAYGTALAAFVIAYLLLSVNFLKFSTTKKNAAMKGKKEKVKAGSPRRALFLREWNLYSSSPNYVLNSSFGVVFILGIGIFAIIKASLIRDAILQLQAFLPNASGCAIAAVLVMITDCMNDITAPSISMEGKRIYLLRALPVAPMNIFLSKIALHLVVVLPALLFTTVAFSVILGADIFGAIMIPIACIAFTLFNACFGLCLNLIRPILDWKDETMAVKTGLSVFLSIFGTIMMTLAIGGLYILLAFVMPDGLFLLLLTLMLLGASWGMLYWLSTVGKRKFEALS